MKQIRIIQILMTFAVMVQISCEKVPSTFNTKYNRINIATYLYENKDTYSSFIKVMESGGIAPTLSSYNPNGDRYTLFLPDDNAFERYINESENYNSMDELLADKEFVDALSRYHIVNTRIVTNDFPLGALPDTTLNGYTLTINYIIGEDSIYFKVNNRALVTREDMEMANGIIHIVDVPLEPVVFSGWDWINNNPDYSLFAEVLELTKLKDTLGATIVSPDGGIKENPYSMLIEADSIFNKSGFYTIDDLKQKFSPDRTDYTSPDNDLYQFAAYHIFEQAAFLADLDGDRNYNTYAILPCHIYTGIDIQVNKGVQVFDSVYESNDTIYTYIDYINIMVNESNVQVRNGPIHFIDQVMVLFKPNKSLRIFQFYEEPVIGNIRNETRRYIFKRVEDFSVISWTGTEELIWEKRGSSSESAWNRDFLEIDGDFSISYDIPKLLPGKYGVQIRADHRGSKNATIQVYLDGKQIGDNLNLTTGGASGANPYRIKNLVVVELLAYENHNITVRSLIPGRFVWDAIIFQPNLNTYQDNTQ
ncbi:fasciclin domain-containing protein [Bacteroidota bacterium]